MRARPRRAAHSQTTTVPTHSLLHTPARARGKPNERTNDRTNKRTANQGSLEIRSFELGVCVPPPPLPPTPQRDSDVDGGEAAEATAEVRNDTMSQDLGAYNDWQLRVAVVLMAKTTEASNDAVNQDLGAQ